MAASIAHEINQPLAAVVTNGSASLRWLAMKPPNLEEARGAVTRAVQEANRAGEVITRIRALLTRASPEMRSVNANEIVRDVLSLTSNELLKGGVTVRTELAADAPPVLGDRIQLQQVILNLVRNAIDAMSTIGDRPRELLIRSAKDTNSVLIQIEDSGSGLDPEQAERIFEPFFTTKPQGLGMGHIAKSRRSPMTDREDIVFVIDDDASMREALNSLIRSVGLRAELFGSAKEFLRQSPPSVPSCLVVDIRLPGMSGLEFQRHLAEADVRTPVIFITAHGDVPMSVRAMKAGAVEFLTKPFRDQDLLDAIQLALESDRARLQREAQLAVLRHRFDSLTPREREVLPLVVSGRLNKEIAKKLGTSEITIKMHRASAMRKMQAESLVDLVKMAARLGLPGTES
ncbi:MAG: hypothetical protein DMG96_35195 [Acidobacteria bacterium]|nr:MAG: hypothetical protein DMG96_35195 [Acidobacteriota bacterium]